MNRNFIIIFILLFTLSMINAVPHQLRKRETNFDSCLVGKDVVPLTVKINPDPPVAKKPESFTVSGTLNDDILAYNTVLMIGFVDSTGALSLTAPYFQKFVEPVKAGTPFSINASKVPTPVNLPDVYIIRVIVGDLNDNIYGCALAVVGETLRKEAYPIAGYPISGPIAERSYPISER
ncbi:hypothetical protein GLOIN_2v1553339 [Rhizophagus irregularis DAOM 181602=DAOM 197198]|uniref:MD-2-related lipid-recognition domain-containing protein n=2 Tax=Rhizophagus irregularis TaxID=588596 RepID=A0A2P4QGU6_RHIID|nr:hypothetical protein GLOIN_2v1553339 [Rhizophagus irregularis DAOM 181602=DAOM 197198]POG76862.1 hypothetical protein GLOIN_2v1553339 [Rhizophagus irregularis DAOM 181602=DAOM 197198]|eukprot:XP_025183728.1 hypothetical protein GLOIN_2v1553339 [Rhizophagus irregularis DAOM 181602=DAOM 197198]